MTDTSRLSRPPNASGWAVSSGPRAAIKRLGDVLGAIVLVVLLLPVMVVFALALRMESPGPVLYRQLRVGRGGSLIHIYKLRTMFVGADRQQAEVWAQGADSGTTHKCPDDPRVTRIGALLRRTSIDEVPQVLNVLIGQMSLVGPRPLQPVEVAGLTAAQNMRHSVRPGLTGLWQVSGRNRTTWDERIALDMSYVSSWSLRGDLAILVRTVGAVWRQDGAY